MHATMKEIQSVELSCPSVSSLQGALALSPKQHFQHRHSHSLTRMHAIHIHTYTHYVSAHTKKVWCVYRICVSSMWRNGQQCHEAQGERRKTPVCVYRCCDSCVCHVLPGWTIGGGSLSAGCQCASPFWVLLIPPWIPCVCVCMHVCLSVCMYTHVYVCVCVCVFLFRVCVGACLCV